MSTREINVRVAIYVRKFLEKETMLFPGRNMPLKSIEFNFSIYRNGPEIRRLLWKKDNTVEAVCFLSDQRSKPDTHVDLTLDMEDYYRIKDQEKQSNK